MKKYFHKMTANESYITFGGVESEVMGRAGKLRPTRELPEPVQTSIYLGSLRFCGIRTVSGSRLVGFENSD